MKPKLRVARALSARLARRMIRLAVNICLVCAAVAFGLIWALAHFFSAWWWLLLLPFFVVLGIFAILWLIASFITRRLYSGPLNREQRIALDSFSDKVQQLLEARATPPIFFVIISLKDILIHKDITTIKEIIRNSASLRSDYQDLERLF